jgi:hypothetical protein
MKAISTSLLVALAIVMSSFGQQKSIDDVIGALRSGNASETKSGNFRAHIFMRSKGDKELVKELRFQAIE